MSEALIKAIPVGALQTNCYIVGCPKTKQAALIDPGGDSDVIKNVLGLDKLKPTVIVNTHAHIDHIGAIHRLKSDFAIEFGLSEADLPVLDSAPKAASMFDLEELTVPKVDFYLKEGDKVKVGELEMNVIETPGHTKGSVCFSGTGFLIAGDTLFQNSIGRTDLPGGSYEEIMHSIKKKLFKLSEDTVVYPGHGPQTTIGNEKENNPFVKDTA